MDFETLLPFLEKLSSESTDPSVQEVAVQLKKQLSNNESDIDSETVDNDVLHAEEGGPQEKNDEGKLLETGFQELEVEDAEEKAKEKKELASNPAVSVDFHKTAANLWDYLKESYGNNLR